MSCFRPNQARYSIDESGKKRIFFRKEDQETFKNDEFPKDVHYVDPYTGEVFENFSLSLPCGQCIGCRTDRAKSWALRAVHEASLYSDNSFITLTYSPSALSKLCPRGSLDRSHFQGFMKRLREMFDDRVVRVFYAGEYGDKLLRPHFHALLFNVDFSDKEYWKTVNGHDYFNSATLDRLWSHDGESIGYSVIGDVTWESAAYIARYCFKKINGKNAWKHYSRRDSSGELYFVKPEFSQASLKPGLGKGWYDKFAHTDVWPFDEVVHEGRKNRPPRYYDKLLERSDLDLFLKIKEKRMLRSINSRQDNICSRLLVKEKCHKARMSKLVRMLEAEA